MNGFLEAIRTELLHTGVHVLTACPGFTTSNIRYSALDAHGHVKGETMRELILTTQGKFTVFINKWLPSLADKLVYNTLAKEKDSPLKK